MNPKYLSLDNNQCFCCHSITCDQNWNPSLRIYHLILEYLEIKFICQYNQPYSYFKLKRSYDQLFDSLFGKLPSELMEKIINFIPKTGN